LPSIFELYGSVLLANLVERSDDKVKERRKRASLKYVEGKSDVESVDVELEDRPKHWLTN
jgi:hypothetical protein